MLRTGNGRDWLEKRFILSQIITSFFFGGMGATPTKDGMSCLSFPTTVGNTSIEILEGDAGKVDPFVKTII
jgi:N-methylhydantoinase B/oxoprolinase/acetone carboxylase alpha subunit